jgi:hypothetical protein
MDAGRSLSGLCVLGERLQFQLERVTPRDLPRLQVSRALPDGKGGVGYKTRNFPRSIEVPSGGAGNRSVDSPIDLLPNR